MSERLMLIVTCEHGGNRVPDAYQHLFMGCEELLSSHRGLDIGILPFARYIAEAFSAPLHASEVTRLLVDLNRRVGSRTLLSEYSRDLSTEARGEILERYYYPYRRAVERDVDAMIQAGGNVLHLSIHSFTPVLNGQVRSADIGLLYDPSRPAEKNFCHCLRTDLKRISPELRIRFNYPYRGTADSLVTHLRNKFPLSAYAGIEIEINQQYFAESRQFWPALQTAIIEVLTIEFEKMNSSRVV